MIEVHQLLLPVAVVVVCASGGFAFAWWRDVRAGGAVERVGRGRGLTVPVLVSVGGDNRRAYAVVDDGNLRVVGPGTQLVLDGRSYAAAAHRRHRVDDELLEFSTQRGFVDAAGTRYLVGAFADWEPALEAALAGSPRPASRWRRLAAAVPRPYVAGFAAAAVALLAFQGIWAAGHDVSATMVRVVGEEGLESCAVRWTDDGSPGYAEVDCYEPFPDPGSEVVVRVLAVPLAGKALDREGTYEGMTVITGGLAVVLGGLTVGTTLVRVRRSTIRLAARPGPALEVTAPVRVTSDASLTDQLDALARVEGWSDGVTSAPEQPTYQRWLLALTSGRWWPVPLLGGAAVLLEDVPPAVRYALGAAAAGVALWAVVGALTTWRALQPAYTAPVTSEWDYRLVRTVDDAWLALLFLGGRPHWLVPLATEEHPAPVGRCGVRGDLRDGGAVQLLVEGGFWMSSGPVERVDDVVLRDLRDEVADRLRDLGGAPT